MASTVGVALQDGLRPDTRRPTLIEGGTVITPDAVLEEASVLMVDGVIAGVGKGISGAGARRVRAEGKLVMPGMIDLHSDALEKFIEPRPGARFPFEVAVTEFDKLVASCGITTMFHCVCFMDSRLWRSVRSLEISERTVYEINRLALEARFEDRMDIDVFIEKYG